MEEKENEKICIAGKKEQTEWWNEEGGGKVKALTTMTKVKQNEMTNEERKSCELHISRPKPL